jgi:hypothetical protein
MPVCGHLSRLDTAGDRFDTALASPYAVDLNTITNPSRQQNVALFFEIIRVHPEQVLTGNLSQDIA